jgi:hypothetical protein
MMFEKQEMKIGLLKTNVAAIKRKEDLALLTADTSSMCDEVKAWHKAQCDLVLAKMRSPSASSNPTPATNHQMAKRKKKWRRCLPFEFSVVICRPNFTAISWCECVNSRRNNKNDNILIFF